MYSALPAGILQRPIALTGFMGVGKSSVGRLLAAHLGLELFDVDSMIEERTGMSVAELFASRGEPQFRTLERETVAEVVANGRSVIALGGGAFVDPSTRELLIDKALVVHLHLPWSQMREVLDGLESDRPLLQGKTSEEVHDLYLQRLRAYRKAHLRVTVPRSSPEDGTGRVLMALERLRHAVEAPPAGGGPVS